MSNLNKLVEFINMNTVQLDIMAATVTNLKVEQRLTACAKFDIPLSDHEKLKIQAKHQQVITMNENDIRNLQAEYIGNKATYFLAMVKWATIRNAYLVGMINIVLELLFVQNQLFNGDIKDSKVVHSIVQTIHEYTLVDLTGIGDSWYEYHYVDCGNKLIEFMDELSRNLEDNKALIGDNLYNFVMTHIHKLMEANVVNASHVKFIRDYGDHHLNETVKITNVDPYTQNLKALLYDLHGSAEDYELWSKINRFSSEKLDDSLLNSFKKSMLYPRLAAKSRSGVVAKTNRRVLVAEGEILKLKIQDIDMDIRHTHDANYLRALEKEKGILKDILKNVVAKIQTLPPGDAEPTIKYKDLDALLFNYNTKLFDSGFKRLYKQFSGYLAGVLTNTSFSTAVSTCKAVEEMNPDFFNRWRYGTPSFWYCVVFAYLKTVVHDEFYTKAKLPLTKEALVSMVSMFPEFNMVPSWEQFKDFGLSPSPMYNAGDSDHIDIEELKNMRFMLAAPVAITYNRLPRRNMDKEQVEKLANDLNKVMSNDGIPPKKNELFLGILLYSMPDLYGDLIKAQAEAYEEELERERLDSPGWLATMMYGNPPSTAIPPMTENSRTFKQFLQTSLGVDDINTDSPKLKKLMQHPSKLDRASKLELANELSKSINADDIFRNQVNMTKDTEDFMAAQKEIPTYMEALMAKRIDQLGPSAEEWVHLAKETTDDPREQFLMFYYLTSWGVINNHTQLCHLQFMILVRPKGALGAESIKNPAKIYSKFIAMGGASNGTIDRTKVIDKDTLVELVSVLIRETKYEDFFEPNY